MHNSFDSFLSDGRCTELAHPDKFNFGLSLFILVGILVSYLPQHLRIIFRRSSEGLSPLFVLLGTVSGTCAIFNIVSLPTSQADVACCKEISGLACTASILGIAQVGVQWFCFFIIMLLFIIFIPRPIPSRANPRASWENTPSPTWREAVTVVAICMATFVAVFIITGVFFLRYPQNLQVWANLLGASAGVMACIQYLPQIWTTWRLQHVMSLSVPMMCIQTPGSFVFAASLGLRLGWDGWSAWGVYIVTGILQGFLLVMGIIFLIRDRKADKKV
ncbi:PQ loop repeat protein-like protein, partial [Patellaria atrata CBS 101060]